MYKKEPIIRSLVFFVCLLLCHSCSPKSEIRTQETNAAAMKTALEEKWGMQIVAVRLTEAGFLVDFRYYVTDPEKAKAVFDSSIKPYLIDQKSGVKLIVPSMDKVGSLRGKTREPSMNRQYYYLFGNGTNIVKRGDKVTVIIGDFKAENLVVE